MPTVTKEATFRYHPAATSVKTSLADFVNAFLREWLLNGPGYSISKSVKTAADVAKGTVLDLNLGGLLVVVTNVDRSGGLVEYEMDPNTNLSNGPVLSALRGEIAITEQEQQADDHALFHVVWKVDYSINLLLDILSIGITRLSLQNMWQTLIDKDLVRLEQQLGATSAATKGTTNA